MTPTPENRQEKPVPSLKTILTTLTLGTAIGFAGPSLAQDYPTKPIRLVVPGPAGGVTDILARVVGEKLRIALGQPVIVDNKAGAQTVIGIQAVASAEPDGYTIGIMSNTLITVSVMRKDLPLDPQTAVVPIVNMAVVPTVLALNPSLPARDWPSFQTMVNGTKDGLMYSSPNIGSTPHLAGEQLARQAKLNMIHVPQKGTPPALTDLLNGNVPAMMAPVSAVLPYIKEGKVIPIVVTDANRSADLPNVPTVREAGLKDYTPMSSWFGLVATAGTPPAIVQKLNAEVNKILAMPDVQEKLRIQTFAFLGGSSADFAKEIREERARNAKVIAEANIKDQ
jgi:tripartite-type tricarboxylate transporter receptor subunit TctC